MSMVRLHTGRARTLIALGFVLVLASVGRSPALAAGDPPAAGQPQQWLSIGEVYRRLETAGYRNVEKIKREHGAYEVRATDRNGVRAKLRVDPRSGEIATRRGEERWRDAERASRSGRERSPAGECNRRRCRDDLPSAAPGTAR